MRLRSVLGATFAALLGCVVAEPARASVWPTSHQRIAKALETGDESERRTAASKLLELPPKLAGKLAMHALADGDIEVRLAAARAAAALGVEGAGDEVVSWLQDADVRLRVAACELIEAAPTVQSVQALSRVLGDVQASVRQAAAAAMGSSGMEDVVAPLLGHLDDSAMPVRLEVVRALGRIGDQRAVTPLMNRLQDQSAEVRREAALALGELGDPRAAASLMLALQDRSVPVQVQVLQALGRLRASDSVTAIAALLGQEGDLAVDPAAAGPVQDAALVALGRIGTPEAVKMLIEALEREGPLPLTSGTRAPVRDALAQAGAPGVEGLIDALAASPSQRLASAIALTLAHIGHKGSDPSTDSVGIITRATRRGTVGLDAGLRALQALGDKDALPFVLEHIEDPDSSVRRVVVDVASSLLDPKEQDGRAVDVVEGRVSDLRTPIGERIALVRLLGKTGSPRALAILLKLSSSKQVALRAAVLESTGTLGVSSKKVDKVLLDALGDPSERIRLAAAYALADVGKDRAVRALIHRLGVSAEQDRAAICLALSGALARATDPRLVARVARALKSSSGSARDALIEGLGRMRIKEAGALLAKLRKRPLVDDRRKVAEALGGHPEAEGALLELLADNDPSVRANAAWSLGKVGSAASVAGLKTAVKDLDAAVAANAAVSLGKVAARAKKPDEAAAPLCEALGDFRSYVRAAALTGMRLGNIPMVNAAACKDGGPIRHILKRDPSWRVREAGAAWLAARAKAGQADELDKRALIRCAAEDHDATVASRCAAPPSAPAGSDDVLVYVVPDGKTTPMPRAPFALVLPDGSLRSGVADRRGSLFELAAPSGTLELAVPAALAK